MNCSWTNSHASTLKVLKKVLSYICLIILLGCAMFPISKASAATEADPYLLGGRWKMELIGWGKVRYMNFYSDGTGIMEIPVAAISGIMYDNIGFTWNTYPYGHELFINISFTGEYGDDYPWGWGVMDVPYKANTYKLLWNPQFMILEDWTHSGTDDRGFNVRKSIYLTEKQPTYSF